MTILLILLTCLLLSPWIVQFFRYVTTRPEAIPTPTWMVTTNVLFLFLMPLLSGLVWGETFTGHERAAGWIAYTTIAYWFTFAAVYRLLSHGQRTVQPDGPVGCQTAFGIFKAAALSMTLTGALLVYVPLVLIRVFFIQVWGLGISGGGLAMLDLPYHLVIVMILSQSAIGPFTTVFACFLFGRTSTTAKVLALGPLVANFVFAALVGRRPVLMYFGLLALGMMWSGRRRTIVPLVGLGLTIWFSLAVFSPVFLRARAMWRSPNGPDVLTAFKIAIEQGGEQEKAEKMGEESSKNVKQRMNTYRFWLEFYDAYIGKPLGGLALLQAILMNTPRLLIGLFKYAYGPTVEYLYGTPDISNNVCLESFLDLGPLGPFIHGSVLGAVFVAHDRLIIRVASWNKYGVVVAAAPMLECLVSPEDALSGYFSLLRNAVVIAILVFAGTLIIGRRPAAMTLRIPARVEREAWSPNAALGATTP